LAPHFRDGRSYVLGGEYDDTLVRTPDGWKIAVLTLAVLWQQGDRKIFT